MGIDDSLTVCTEAYNPKGVIQVITLLFFFHFFPPRKANLCCGVFYISPAESTLFLLSLVIRKCESAACKYVADWSNPQGSLLIWHSLRVQVPPDSQVKER